MISLDCWPEVCLWVSCSAYPWLLLAPSFFGMQENRPVHSKADPFRTPFQRNTCGGIGCHGHHAPALRLVGGARTSKSHFTNGIRLVSESLGQGLGTLAECGSRLLQQCFLVPSAHLGRNRKCEVRNRHTIPHLGRQLGRGLEILGFQNHFRAPAPVGDPPVPVVHGP